MINEADTGDMYSRDCDYRPVRLILEAYWHIVAQSFETRNVKKIILSL